MRWKGRANRRIAFLLCVCIMTYLLPMDMIPGGQIKAQAASEDLPAGYEDYTPIRTVDDLYQVRNGMSGKYILMNDLDLSEATAGDGKYSTEGKGWCPLGYAKTGNKSFTGIFDGYGHTITGLTINGAYTQEVTDKTTKYAYAGLFYSIRGTIRDLHLEDVDIAVPGVYGYTIVRIGAVAAVVSNGGELSGCSVTGKLSYDNKNAIQDASAYTYTYNDDDLQIGGLVGITGTDGTKAYVSSCWSKAEISISSYSKYNCPKLGGIIGWAYGATTVSGCWSQAEINSVLDLATYTSTATQTVGGIIGYANGAGAEAVVTVENCFNTQGVIVVKNKNDYTYGNQNVSHGGIVGYAVQYVTITQCYSVDATSESLAKDSNASSHPIPMTFKGITGAKGTTGISVTKCYTDVAGSAPAGETGIIVLSDEQFRRPPVLNRAARSGSVPSVERSWNGRLLPSAIRQVNGR